MRIKDITNNHNVELEATFEKLLFDLLGDSIETNIAIQRRL